MRNFRMTLQYEGTRYQGWQKQESTDNTIQGKLESLLTKMVNEDVAVQGSGRTDAGVHAKGQIANFHCNTDMTESEIMEYINTYLPEDVAVVDLKEVPERFHARLNAKGKIYQYRVLNSNVPHIFDRRYVYQAVANYDVEAMKKAAKFLCGTHDFKAFTSAKKGKKSTVRTIHEIKIEEVNDEIRFTFYGNGFLYHMVRILMGTLLEVGRGEKTPEMIPDIIEGKKREAAGELVPAKGLTLLEVLY